MLAALGDERVLSRTGLRDLAGVIERARAAALVSPGVIGAGWSLVTLTAARRLSLDVTGLLPVLVQDALDDGVAVADVVAAAESGHGR